MSPQDGAAPIVGATEAAGVSSSATSVARTTPPTSAAGSFALSYAARGWSVFPCRDKRPLTDHGVHDATTDHGKVREWWARWPEAQVAVACGASGLLVVDVDGERGNASLDELLHDGPAGCGLTASTPRGGHLFFRAVDGAAPAVGVRPGIDVRAAASYVIVPHGTADRQWTVGDPLDDDDLAEAPQWVRDLIAKAPPAAADAPPRSDADKWATLVEGVAEGGRNGTLAREVGRMLAHHIPAPVVRLAAEEFGRRCSPPMDPAEVSRTVASIIAGDRERHPERHQPVDVDGCALATSRLEPEAQRRAIRMVDWTDVCKLPPVRWQVRGMLPERSMALIAGTTEIGKSFVLVDLSMRLVHGMEFFGQRVLPCSVAYLAGEGQAGYGARFRAWREQHGVTDAAAEGRYCLVSDAIPELSAENRGQVGALIAETTRQKGHAPGIVIIDTLSQGLVADENANAELAAVMRDLADVRNQHGCSIVLAHHPVKRDRALQFDRNGNERWLPLTLDQIRGAGSITRNIDTVWGVQTTQEDRACFEITSLKQKDGRKFDPIRFRRLEIETGVFNDDGEPETSCILVPAGAIDKPVEKSADERRIERETTGIAKLVAAVRREGRFGSRDALVQAADLGNLQQGRACLDLALTRKAIVDVGRSKRPVFVLPEHADAVRKELAAERGIRPAEGGEIPPIPPLDGRTDSVPSVPSVHNPSETSADGLDGSDGSDGFQAPANVPDVGGRRRTSGRRDPIDDGRSEQPGGRRRRARKPPPDPMVSALMRFRPNRKDGPRITIVPEGQ